jgi:hypothetical protein
MRSPGNATPPSPYTGAFFEVLQSSDNGKLAIGATLEGNSIGATITLDGGGNAANPPPNAPLITVGKDCIIGNDVTLQNNKNTSAGALGGGGVYVRSGGNFIMVGGIISQNNSSNGAGVYAEGAFTMSGGSITNNVATNNGGGVYLAGSGIFNINSPAASGASGNVRDNTAATGANNPNVYFDNTGLGTISGTGLNSTHANGW